MSCITFSCISIIFNNAHTLYFYLSRDMRKGDPLYLYLYILCIKMFSKSINIVVDHLSWQPYISVCVHLPFHIFSLWMTSFKPPEPLLRVATPLLTTSTISIHIHANRLITKSPGLSSPNIAPNGRKTKSYLVLISIKVTTLIFPSSNQPLRLEISNFFLIILRESYQVRNPTTYHVQKVSHLSKLLLMLSLTM